MRCGTPSKSTAFYRNKHEKPNVLDRWLFAIPLLAVFFILALAVRKESPDRRFSGDVISWAVKSLLLYLQLNPAILLVVAYSVFWIHFSLACKSVTGMQVSSKLGWLVLFIISGVYLYMEILAPEFSGSALK